MSVSDRPLVPSVPFELRRVALLELMPTDVRRLVEASFTPVEFGFGEVIVTEGDQADALFVIQSGTARVVKAGDDGVEVPLNVLRAGDVFGERALLDRERKRTATIRASSPVEALRLDRHVFEALVRSEPKVGHYVELRIRRHELSDFLREYTAFADLPPEVLRLLLEGLVPKSVSAGEVVIRQGDPAGAMYIVRNGRLRAYIDRDAKREQRSYLRRGDFFGEVSLLRGTDRTASVEAVSDCELWALEPELFARLVDEDPEFRQRIEQRIAAYDYRRFAHVPLDFADELLPADAAGPEALSAQQTEAAGAEYPPQAGITIEEDFDGFVRPARRIRRFPHVMQVDTADAGAASLAMICRYYGRKVSTTLVRDAVNTAVDGTSLLGIRQGAESLGLSVRTAKVSKSRLDEMPLPAILHWANNHWLVVYDVDAQHARVADPARGCRRIPRSELESKWSGYAAFLAPTEALLKTPVEKSRIGWLLGFFRPYRRSLLLAVVLGFVAAGASMLVPVISKFIVDRVIVKHDVGLLTALVLIMFGALGISVMATYVQRLLLSRVAVSVDRASLDTLSEALLALPMSYFHARRTGDIGRRLNGMQLVRDFLVQRGVQTLTSIAQVIVALAIMSVYSWPLSLIYLIFAASLYTALLRFTQRRLRPVYEGLEEHWSRYQSRQIDSIRGIETVKAMGAEKSLRRILLKQFDELSERLYRADLTAMLFWGGIQLLSFLSLALFLWLGALQVLHHRMTIGELISFNALVLLANQAVVSIVGIWDQLQRTVVLLNRLNDILDHDAEQGTDHSGLTPVKSLSGHVHFRRLTFKYPGPAQAPVLDEVDFEVQPGTRVAIVGRSGSGKTTLIKCLCGLIEPTGGTILYDGADLTGLDLRQLRQHIGFVLQENHMFNATIAENIAFGCENPDPEQVMWAARVANAAGFIERLPRGYETPIGETGLLLSGGQRQRIAIARAVYHRPPVLVFDEATSALDTESERAVKDNLDQLLQGRTSFVIAHRLSTVRDSDIILVLEKGRLVESGTHDALLAREGLYYYLCSQQLTM
ncbi:peptidase domain-containing ABC transporter [Mycobacterium sp.]|uniref:peptidase domain-containing ABC transporter n=1 Tax=Mycobacterium sp. TaxID=1785 RepID=UPI002CB4DEC1|nr:peptidase domain-containing ABC transporter [Mycobacterium sp.]HTQ18079.1 peptidase domain-containing ABC transporter [Mycobacterium sp.]